MIRSIAHVLRKLHDSEPSGQARNIFDEVALWLSLARERGGWLPDDIDELVDAYKDMTARFGVFRTDRPCHLDLFLSNIITTQEGVHLIDWEYAGDGDYCFDLGLFFAAAQFSQQEEAIFLEAYGEVDTDFHKKVSLVKSLSAFREGVYGSLRGLVSDSAFDGNAHAKEHFDTFRSLLEI